MGVHGICSNDPRLFAEAEGIVTGDAPSPEEGGRQAKKPRTDRHESEAGPEEAYEGGEGGGLDAARQSGRLTTCPDARSSATPPRPSSVDGRVRVDPLAHDPVPVALRPQLGQDGEQPDLHPPAHQLVGGDGSRAASGRRSPSAGRRSTSMIFITRSRRDLVLAVLEVPAADQHHVVHQPLGVELASGCGRSRGRGAPRRSASGSLRDGGVDGALLELDLLAVELLGHAEVEEGDPAVVHQQVVAGVGVGVEVLQVVDRAEAEAEDDLAEAVCAPPAAAA